MENRHQPVVRKGSADVLGARLRLARPGSAHQCVPAVQGADRRHRCSFPSRPVQAAERDAAAARARLAGIDRRVPRADPAAHRAFHRGRALAAGLHAVLRARTEALRRRGNRRHVREADDRGARLQEVRHAGWRLGRVHHLAHGGDAPGAVHRPASQLPDGAARQVGRSRLAGAARGLGEGAFGVLDHPGHAPADPGLRPHRFTGRPRGVDRREVPRLDRQRRHDRERDRARRHARQHLALLVHRRHRLVVLDLLRAQPRPLAGAVPGHRADRLRRISRRRSCGRRAPSRRSTTPTSSAGRQCRKAGISPRSSSRKRWRATL